MRTASWLLLGLVACVPETEEKHARGAAGFVTVPSEAARGEPFQTADGWSVRIENLALLVNVSARARQPNDDYYGSGGGQFLIPGATPADVYNPGLPLGTYEVSAYLADTTIYKDEARVYWENSGVEASLARRFETVIEETRDRYGYAHVPGAVVVARGTKADRTVVIDQPLWVNTETGYSNFPGLGTGPTVDVRQNAVGLRALDVRPEVLFVDGFGEIAEADRRGDNDGHASLDELSKMTSSCTACGTKYSSSSSGYQTAPLSVLDALRVRLTQLLRAH